MAAAAAGVCGLGLLQGHACVRGSATVPHPLDAAGAVFWPPVAPLEGWEQGSPVWRSAGGAGQAGSSFWSLVLWMGGCRIVELCVGLLLCCR